MVAVCVTPLDGSVLALDIAEIPQFLKKGRIRVRARRCGPRQRHQDPDARDLPRLLRLSG